jgi:hypothetical protein
MTYQLRIYDIKEGALEEFVALWTEVAPLRQRFGFEIAGAWVVEDTNQFVWIIGHNDFSTADKAYYDSPERAALNPDPRDLIVKANTRFMRSVA